MDDVRVAASRLGVFHFAAGFQTRAPTSEQARRQAGSSSSQTVPAGDLLPRSKQLRVWARVPIAGRRVAVPEPAEVMVIIS